MQEVCRLLQIDKTRTTPYHPQSDGLVELFNRTMLAMLASTVEEDPSNWEQHLRKVCMAYNTYVQPSTGYTPFYLMFGRLARLPVDMYNVWLLSNRTRATSSVCKDIKRYTGKCLYEGSKTHAGNSNEIRRTVQQKSARSRVLTRLEIWCGSTTRWCRGGDQESYTARRLAHLKSLKSYRLLCIGSKINTLAHKRESYYTLIG